MFSISTITTRPTGRSRRSRDLASWRGWQTDQQKIEQSASLRQYSRLLWVGCVLGSTSAHSTFRSRRQPKSPWPLRTEGVEAFLASSISVRLQKGCVMSMLWRKNWEISQAKHCSHFLALMGWKTGNITQNYTVCYNITKYYRKTDIETLQSKINSSSSIVVILSMGRTCRYVGTNTSYQVQKNYSPYILVLEL